MTTGRRNKLWLALALLAAVAAGWGGAVIMRAQRPMEEAALYHCPMHPAIVLDKPGQCPICSMRLVPMDQERANGPSMEMAPGGVGDAPPSTVDGLTAVNIPVRRQQLIGVRTGEVRRGAFVRRIHAVGRVTVDETRLHHVHTKVAGWVEKLHVNATGEKVRRGDPLLTLYSPELLASQEEYPLALRSRDHGLRPPDEGRRQESLPEVARLQEGLLESTRRRLLLFDFTPEQIADLEKSGEASRTVTLFSPSTGYVLKRNVTHGEKIDSSVTLLDIADLSRVWVLASIYEYELPFIKAGQPATMTPSYLPGRTYRGRVAFVYPVLEGATRTAQARLEFDNADLELKPEMYADVEIESDAGQRLLVPASAVLSSGTRNVVFVAQGEGYFVPREVQVGLRLPDVVEILGGVSEGERIVTSGNFLVDSESKLKAVLEAASAPASAPQTRPQTRPLTQPGPAENGNRHERHE